MIFIIVPLIGFGFLPLITEIIENSIFGKRINLKKLDLYLDKYIDRYVESGVNSRRTIFYGDPSMPYIAQISPTFGPKWYIDGVGRIPRRSKWTKILDENLAKFPKPLKSEDKLDELIFR